MPGEVSLRDVLQHLDSSSAKIRETALSDLKHILWNASKLAGLEDDSVHRVYEALFRVSLNEQSTYFKTKNVITRTSVENRLTSCANCLRHAVQATKHLIKYKTATSVLDHVIHSLPLASGGFCDPLAIDYAKSLRALLSYQPHVEHLLQKDRERLLEFCVECIRAARTLVDDHDWNAEDGDAVIARPIVGIGGRSSRSFLPDSNRSQSQSDRSVPKQVAGEMVACLLYLTAAPNFAIGSRAGSICSVLIHCSRSGAFASTAIHLDALGGICNVLSRTRTDNISLTKDLVTELVGLIKVFWSPAMSPNLSKQLLVIWLYLLPYILSLMRDGSAPSLWSDLSDVIQVMREEYSVRQPREKLQIDDTSLEFAPLEDDLRSIRTRLFSLQCVSGKSESRARAENAWTTVFIMAALYRALKIGQPLLESSAEDGRERSVSGSSKRIRRNDDMEDLFRSSSYGPVSDRICNLQILTFLAQQMDLTVLQYNGAIDTLSTSCTEDDSNIASWALLGLASLASQQVSTGDDDHSNRWDPIWNIATRASTNTVTCRAACHLLCTLINLRLVSDTLMTDLVHSICVSTDLSGPSMLADSTVRLVLSLCRFSRRAGLAFSPSLEEGALRWLMRHFAPSRFVERSYASQHTSIDPSGIIDLIALCLHQPGPNVGHCIQYSTWDTVGQAWILCAEQRALINYLLLEPNEQGYVRPIPPVSSTLR